MTAPYYTFRISAPDAAGVAVSVDDGEWSPCRFSIGYWWHDWSDYESGSHQVRARACDAGGAITAVDSRRVDVRLHERPEGLRNRVRHGRRGSERPIT